MITGLDISKGKMKERWSNIHSKKQKKTLSIADISRGFLSQKV
jgi:hypothetical protein